MIESATERIARACLEAPLRERPWDHMAHALGRELDGRCILITHAPGWSPMGPTAHSGIDASQLASVCTHYHRSNPWARAAAHYETGTFSSGYATFSPQEMRRTEFYNDWMRPCGFASEHVYGGFPVTSEDGHELVLAVLSQTGSRELSEQELELGRRSVGFLRRAYALVKRFDTPAGVVSDEREAPWSRSVLDQLGLAALVVDADRRVEYRNRAAEELFRDGSHLRLRRQRLSLHHPPDQRRLAELVCIACSHVTSRGGTLRVFASTALTSEVVRVDSQSKGHAAGPHEGSAREVAQTAELQLVVLPLAHAGPQPDRALILVPPRTLPKRQTLELLRSGFGLSPAEARLTVRLAELLDLRRAAEAESLSYETARTYLKRATDKLGVRSQAAVIRLVHDLSVSRDTRVSSRAPSLRDRSLTGESPTE